MGTGNQGQRGRYPLHAPVAADNPVTAHRVGDAREHGRFERSDAPFSLAPHLPADGAATTSDALDAVITDWQRQANVGGVSADTVRTYAAAARTFQSYAARRADLLCDVTSELVWLWVNSPATTGGDTVAAPTQNMRGLRRSVAVAIYRTLFNLGFTERNVTANLPRIARPPRKVSAFTATQIDKLKDHADHDTDTSTYESGYSRTPACLALTLVGAQSGEVGAIRVVDIDLDAWAVRLHGGGTRYQPRTVPIDDSWAWEALAARVAYLAKKYPGDANRPVAYNPTPGSKPSFATRSAATSGTLGALIKAAGLRKPGKIRVASINEYVAADLFAKTGRVEVVATRLGMRSLDAAAHLVGWDWREQFTPDQHSTLDDGGAL